MPLHIHLCDRNAGMTEAWERAFEAERGVTIRCADIFAEGHPKGPGVAIVSPANSFGHMDGGIDLVYSQHFGWDMEGRLRKLLLEQFHGELPVGLAVIVPTGNDDIPWLVSAPTMRVPMNVAKTANAFLAFRAALLAVRRHNGTGATPIDALYCPGLCTANGSMPYDRAAKQMRAAFDAVEHGKILETGGLARAVTEHMWLVDDT